MAPKRKRTAASIREPLPPSPSPSASAIQVSGAVAAGAASPSSGSNDGDGPGSGSLPDRSGNADGVSLEIKEILLDVSARLGALEQRFGRMEQGQIRIGQRVDTLSADLTMLKDGLRGLQATQALLSVPFSHIGAGGDLKPAVHLIPRSTPPHASTRNIHTNGGGSALSTGPSPSGFPTPTPSPASASRNNISNAPMTAASSSSLGTSPIHPSAPTPGAGPSTPVPRAARDSDVEHALGVPPGSLVPLRTLLGSIHTRLQALPRGHAHKMDLEKKFTDVENNGALEHFIDAVQRACLTSTDERLRAFASPTHRAFVRASIHKKWNHWHSQRVKTDPQKEADLQANRRRSRIGRKYASRRATLENLLPSHERSDPSDSSRPAGDPAALTVLREAVGRYGVSIDLADLQKFVGEKSCHSEEDTASQRVTQADLWVRPVQPSWRTEAGSAVFRKLDEIASIKRKHSFVGRGIRATVPYPQHLQGTPYVQAYHPLPLPLSETAGAGAGAAAGLADALSSSGNRAGAVPVPSTSSSAGQSITTNTNTDANGRLTIPDRTVLSAGSPSDFFARSQPSTSTSTSTSSHLSLHPSSSPSSTTTSPTSSISTTAQPGSVHVHHHHLFQRDANKGPPILANITPHAVLAAAAAAAARAALARGFGLDTGPGTDMGVDAEMDVEMEGQIGSEGTGLRNCGEDGGGKMTSTEVGTHAHALVDTSSGSEVQARTNGTGTGAAMEPDQRENTPGSEFFFDPHGGQGDGDGEGEAEGGDGDGDGDGDAGGDGEGNGEGNGRDGVGKRLTNQRATVAGH